MQKVCCLLSLSFVFIVNAFATPVPALSVDDLVKNADLIVIGQIISVTQTGVHSGAVNGIDTRMRVLTAEVSVDQILKGVIDGSRVKVVFELPEEFVGYQSVPIDYRIVFLKINQGAYSFVTPYYPSLPAVAGAPLEEGSVIDRVSYELQTVVEHSDIALAQKQEALMALATLRTPAATAALKKALQQPTRELQLTASAALLERNEIAGLPIAEAALMQRPRLSSNHLVHNLAYAIATGVADRRAIPALLRLIELPEIEVRRAAAAALARTRSTDSLPGLEKALEDSDFEVRYFGVVGLAEITGKKEWHPNMEVFQAEETKYLTFWRNWIRETGTPKSHHS